MADLDGFERSEESGRILKIDRGEDFSRNLHLFKIAKKPLKILRDERRRYNFRLTLFALAV
jgi:hypothetical protein